jgi:hypothetical protein
MDHDDLRYCECGNMLDENGCCRRCECEPPGEHRGSRPGVDPTFIDAAFREFTPDQEAMFREKSEAIWRAANGVRR